MSLSGVPEGYLSLTQAVNVITTAIASTVGHKVSELKKILDPDAVEKAPPKAMFEAGFKALFKPICQGKIDVFTMHPTSSEIIQVPLNVFVGSSDPQWLFKSPSPHFDAGLPTGYEEYGKHVLFIRNDNHTKDILEEAAKSILGMRTWPEKQSLNEPDSKGRLWATEVPTLVNWPVEFVLAVLGHGGQISDAVEEYSSWIDYGDSRYPSAMAFSKYGGQARQIEVWARSGALGITGVRVLRQGQRERPAGVSALDWMDLEIRHDMYEDRGLYASPPRPVPLAEWWERLFVERKQFLQLLNSGTAPAKRPGRPPDRQALASEAACALWSKADWPKNMTQLATVAAINKWIKSKEERLKAEGDEEASLGQVTLNTVKAAFKQSKIGS